LVNLDTGNEANVFNVGYATDSDYFGYYLIEIWYVDADYQCKLYLDTQVQVFNHTLSLTEAAYCS